MSQQVPEEAAAAEVSQLLMMGSRLAEELVRQRQARARDVEAGSRQQARELSTRVDAERATALASLARVHDGDWWNHANAPAIADSWRTAKQWQPEPAATAAVEKIGREVNERYGVDLVSLDRAAAGTGVRAAEHLYAAEIALIEARNQEDAAMAARADRDDAQDEAAEAQEPAERIRAQHRADVAQGQVSGAEHRASVDYDTAERRQAVAEQLTEQTEATPEAIGAWLQADTDQATPPGAAVRPSRRPARARKTRSAGRPQRERGIASR